MAQIKLHSFECIFDICDVDRRQSRVDWDLSILIAGPVTVLFKWLWHKARWRQPRQGQEGGRGCSDQIGAAAGKVGKYFPDLKWEIFFQPENIFSRLRNSGRGQLEVGRRRPSGGQQRRLRPQPQPQPQPQEQEIVNLTQLQSWRSQIYNHKAGGRIVEEQIINQISDMIGLDCSSAI